MNMKSVQYFNHNEDNIENLKIHLCSKVENNSNNNLVSDFKIINNLLEVNYIIYEYIKL